MHLLATLLLATVPHDGVKVVHCDEIERNFVYTAAGGCRVDQQIFRQTWPAEILDWRYSNYAGFARPNYAAGYWVVRWLERGELIEVRAPVAYETTSFYDREAAEQEWLPANKRRKVP